MAICIEDMDAESREDHYLRCVALPGRQPGLRLDGAGRVLWQSDDGVSCELWVSADERLILYRPEERAPVTLHRAGRSLDVPSGKPVVVIDQDQVDVGGRHLRVHVHGEAPAVAAPSPLPPRSRPVDRLARAAATAAMMGAVAAASGCSDIVIRDNPPEAPMEPTPTIDVRDFPPEAVEFTPTPTIEVRDDPPTVAVPETPVPATPAKELVQGEWAVAQAYDGAGERVWVTGTLTIAGGAYTFAPTREITGTPVPGALDFLFIHPQGEVVIEEAEEAVATCTFRADSTVVGEFLVEQAGDDTLRFRLPSGDGDLWRITKRLNAE